MAEQTCPLCYGKGIEQPLARSRAHKRRDSPWSGRDPLTAKVREVMTPDVVYGFDEQDIQDAARLMEQYQIRRLPVLNRRKQLVGMVALGDLAVHPGTQPVTAEVLAQVSEPGTSGRK